MAENKQLRDEFKRGTSKQKPIVSFNKTLHYNEAAEKKIDGTKTQDKMVKNSG